MLQKSPATCKNAHPVHGLTHSLIHHFEVIPNSKKLQTTTEMWLLKDFKIQIAQKTLWEKVKLLILSNFTFLAPLAKGQRAIVMALCLSCIRARISKLCLKKPNDWIITKFHRNVP